MKTAWDLKQLYTSFADPRIEKDIASYERAHVRFAKKYRDTQFTKNARALKAALADYEKLAEASVAGMRAILYCWYRKELNSEDQEAEALIARLSDRLTKADNHVIFFPLAIGTIEQKRQKELLKDASLAHYRYLLERIFLEQKHQLSEPEERIMSLKSRPAHSMWVDGVEKLINTKTVSFEGRELPIQEALNMVNTLPTARRRKLHRLALGALRETGYFAESEMNAVFTDKKINDELRGFKKPYSGTVLSYENDERSVESLVKAVTKDFSTSKEFYQVKRKLMGLDHLEYADRSASVGATKKKYSFEESYEILKEVFGKLGDEYRDILIRLVENGQVDVYPKKGKSGGAYCSGASGVPTMLLLNHVDSLNSLLTFAHEMGHAIHTELSKKQPILYQDYSTAVAETASTFFEGAVFDHIFDTLTEKEKKVALHDRISDDISTIYRQIAFFNFELALHTKVRAEGFVSKESIAALLNEHMRSYMGPAVKLSEDDGYFFTTVSHFRRPFYVYSYAYGQLISKALLARVKDDPAYMERVKTFLTAGGSKKPEEIFNDIGIKTRTPAIFEEGLASIKADVQRLKKVGI